MPKNYHDVYKYSLENPEGFWAEAASSIYWTKSWDKVLDDTRPPFYRWFPGAETNTCYNAVDRHVEAGHGDRIALIYDSVMTGTKRVISYKELQDQVTQFAGVLHEQNITAGDRVIIYMPMVPEAVVAMLGCARLGAIHSVVFGGFAPQELATRIDDCTAELIVTATCGLEPDRKVEYMPIIDEAIELASHHIEKVILLQRNEHLVDPLPGRDIDWHEAMARAKPADWVPVKATDPLYILYTSGTTGQPKGVVRDNGGHMVGLNWSMKNIYNIDQSEVFWAASDIGWVVGHSYIVYAPLIYGCTTLMFEGKPVGTPDAGVFWRVISEYKVAALFTAPTAFRAIKREDPNGELIKNYNLENFRTLFLAGERTDPDTLHWAEEKLNRPVIDHWWQTETGWAMGANCMGIEHLPIKPGSPTKAVPGYDIQILSPSGKQLAAGEMGAICVKLPLPPSGFPTLWNAEKRYVDAYMAEFPGYYQTGDAGHIDEDGYIYVMARTDDVINVAGHRLSTGAIEEVLCNHQDVAEAAVIGVSDQLKGQLPLGFAVLKLGVTKSHADIIQELRQSVREIIGPVAAFKTAVIVERLPKTRSGKILRNTMQKIANSEDYKAPATIEDPTILTEIKSALNEIGYARS